MLLLLLFLPRLLFDDDEDNWRLIGEERGDCNDRVLDAWRTNRRLGVVDTGVVEPPPLSSSNEVELMER